MTNVSLKPTKEAALQNFCTWFYEIVSKGALTDANVVCYAHLCVDNKKKKLARKTIFLDDVDDLANHIYYKSL